MTEAELLAVEERAKASRGPWKAMPSESPESKEWRPLFKVVGSGSDHAYTVADGMLRDNATFIAAARSDVPALVAALREAWGEIERLKEQAKADMDQGDERYRTLYWPIFNALKDAGVPRLGGDLVDEIRWLARERGEALAKADALRDRIEQRVGGKVDIAVDHEPK